jgi:hypothetical protein
VVIRDSIGFPELGTQANPIVIRDGLTPLGSASNPIVIHVDEDWYYNKIDRCGSNTNTKVMATPEFWEALIDENFSIPADKRGAVGSSSVHTPTRSPAHEDPEALHSFGQSSANRLRLDNKALKITKSSFNRLQNCSSLEAIRRENVANGQASKFTAIVLTIFR